MTNADIIVICQRLRITPLPGRSDMPKFWMPGLRLHLAGHHPGISTPDPYAMGWIEHPAEKKNVARSAVQQAKL